MFNDAPLHMRCIHDNDIESTYAIVCTVSFDIEWLITWNFQLSPYEYLAGN